MWYRQNTVRPPAFRQLPEPYSTEKASSPSHMTINDPLNRLSCWSFASSSWAIFRLKLYSVAPRALDCAYSTWTMADIDGHRKSLAQASPPLSFPKSTTRENPSSRNKACGHSLLQFNLEFLIRSPLTPGNLCWPRILYTIYLRIGQPDCLKKTKNHAASERNRRGN